MIVIPKGGFNDMLFVIDKCLRYCIKHERILVIDTRRSFWFLRDIHEYIEFSHPLIYKGDMDTIFATLNKLESYPPGTRGKHPITEVYNDKNICFRSTIDKIDISPDLGMSYTEDVVVYSHCGGGIPVTLLPTMKFKPVVVVNFIEKFQRLPSGYTSVHIRNTDYVSDLDTFLEENHGVLTETPFFLASDNANTIETIREKYLHVLTFSAIPNTLDRRNIHERHHENQESFILDCITDILLLASAKTYIYSCKKSGYSKLAGYLHNNRPLLENLLGTKLDTDTTVNEKQQS
jgi:hypothetical protein